MGDIVNNTFLSKEIHAPEFSWTTKNIGAGVELDIYTQAKIQKAYSTAWYLINRSFAAKKDIGLGDHLSLVMKKKVLDKITLQEKFQENAVELNHNIDVHLMSYDRQLISFTDNYVELRRSIKDLESNHTVHYADTSHYDVVMALEDGNWKIIEMVQINKPTLKAEDDLKSIAVINEKFIAKAINYYPAKNPWFEFWTDFDIDVVNRDLKSATELGFNSVRIFLPYSVFGKASPDEKMMKHLDEFLNALSSLEMKAIVTLFDFPESYKIDLYPATARHLKTIVTRYRNHENIFAWDIKNEADLDFPVHGKQEVLEWLEFNAALIRDIAPHQKITIGWSKPENAHYLADKLDLVSFHSYRSTEEERKHIKLMKAKVKDKDFLISEFGRTSWRSNLIPFGTTENEQAVYTQKMLKMLKEEGILHYAYWTLNDFEVAPSYVFGMKPWIKESQKQMGIIRTDKSLKKTAEVFISNGETNFEKSFWDIVKPFYILFFIGLIVGLFILRFAWKWLSRKNQKSKENTIEDE